MSWQPISDAPKGTKVRVKLKKERAIQTWNTRAPTAPVVAKSYVDGVDDAQFIVVEALRGTRENYITTNRALEITDAAIKALKQGRDYKHLVSPTAEGMKAAMIEKVWEMQLAMDAGKVGSKALLADVITELQSVEVK